MSAQWPKPLDLNQPQLVAAIDNLPLWSAPFGLCLLNTVTLRPGLKVLDVGFGTGFPLIELAERLGCSSTVYGLDLWPEAIARTRLKIEACEVRNVRLVRGAAEQMPLPDESFDLLISNNGLNNVSDQPRALAECRRVSRPGAQLVLTMNGPESMMEFYQVYQQLLQERGLAAEVEALKAHIAAKRQPCQEIQQRLARAGFRVERVIEEAFEMRMLDGTALLNHSLIRMAFLEPWIGVLGAKADRQPFFRALEERLNRLASAQGMLRLTIPFYCLDCSRQ